MISVLTLALLLPICLADYNTTFEWTTSPWSQCRYKDLNKSCCDCYHVRNVTCVFRRTANNNVHDAQKEKSRFKTAPIGTVPPWYCHKGGHPKPVDREACSPCVQDCVTSVWAEWSHCSDSCTPATRNRVRKILVEPTPGGEDCGSLVQSEECVSLPMCAVVQSQLKYRWIARDWSSCRKVSPSLYTCRYVTTFYIIRPCILCSS